MGYLIWDTLYGSPNEQRIAGNSPDPFRSPASLVRTPSPTSIRPKTRFSWMRRYSIPDSYGVSLVKGRRCLHSEFFRGSSEVESSVRFRRIPRLAPPCSGRFDLQTRIRWSAMLRTMMPIASGRSGNQGGGTNLERGVFQPQSGTASRPPWKILGVFAMLPPGSWNFPLLVEASRLTPRSASRLAGSRPSRRSATARRGACGRARWP
jgi:hypothetical protein